MSKGSREPKKPKKEVAKVSAAAASTKDSAALPAAKAGGKKK